MLNNNITSYQKGVHYTGIKLFNALLFNIKTLIHDIEVWHAAAG